LPNFASFSVRPAFTSLASIFPCHPATAMPPPFLMQQMQWREALEEAADVAAVRALQGDVDQRRRRLLDDLRADLDERADPVAASERVRSLMFVDRFVDDLHRRLEALEA
jgi:molecular chaperone HscB